MSTADAVAAARAGAADLIAQIRKSAEGLATDWRVRAEELAALAQRVSDAVAAGTEDGDTAAANLVRLADALASELEAAGYSVKAARFQLIGQALAIVFRIAGAALAA